MNPYAVLDVSPAATLTEIETRYRSMLLIYHPDLNRQKGPEVVAQAEKKTRQLNAAMAILRRQHPAGGVKVGSTERPSERAASSGPSTGPRSNGGAYADGVPFSWGPAPADPNRVYNCPLCGNITENLPDFEEHVARAHNISLDPRAKGKPPRRRIVPIGTFGAIFRFIVWVAIVIGSVWIYLWFTSPTVSHGFETLAGVGLVIWILVVSWLMFSRQR